MVGILLILNLMWISIWAKSSPSSCCSSNDKAPMNINRCSQHPRAGLPFDRSEVPSEIFIMASGSALKLSKDVARTSRSNDG